MFGTLAEACKWLREAFEAGHQGSQKGIYRGPAWARDGRRALWPASQGTQVRLREGSVGRFGGLRSGTVLGGRAEEGILCLV